MSNFCVMSKAIAQSIRNRLLSLPVKFQGQATALTRVLKNFQNRPKTENYFCVCL